jgi:hypothetical protein
VPENKLTASRLLLEIAKLKLHVLLLQTIVLRNDLILRQAEGRQTPSEAVHESLAGLEAAATAIEALFLSDPAYRRLHAAERAQLADEFRELVEFVKSSVVNLGESQKG